MRPPVPDIAACDRFLNRMAWNAATEGPDHVGIVSFSVDCFLFTFQDGFDAHTEYGFFQYAKTLDMADQRAIMKLWIWLTQQRVEFTLRFQWNKRLPVKYNLKQIWNVRAIREKLEGLVHRDVMAYDLTKDTCALHP